MRVRVWTHAEKTPEGFAFTVDALMTERGLPIIVREKGVDVFRPARPEEIADFDLWSYLREKKLLFSPLSAEEALSKFQDDFETDGDFFVFDDILD